MTVPEPPLEAHRYARSQTPESPRPLHIPEPSNIPVLENQMDPVFNDTTTYDIRPNSQPLTGISEKLQDFEASAPTQSTGSLFDTLGQHGLAARNEDAVESNYQTLLDNLSQSTSTAPAAESLAAPTTAEPIEANAQSHVEAEKPLPTAAGLPPRPPPQEKPSIHPSYSANESIRSYHQLPNSNTNTSSFSNQLPSYRQDTSMPPLNVAPPPSTTSWSTNR